MPKRAKELAAIEIRRLVDASIARAGTRARPGPVCSAVGGVNGLYIQCTPNGGTSWVLKYQSGGRRRSTGLGSYPTITIAEARERARAFLARL
ncbi:MAG: DUF4102 domain-containing protein, partial [Burkholderiales bacterium]|nr:DUF4102 domain-containing protein [Burkholderiales bacterium]